MLPRIAPHSAKVHVARLQGKARQLWNLQAGAKNRRDLQGARKG